MVTAFWKESTNELVLDLTTFDRITSQSYIPPLAHPTASRAALICRTLAANCPNIAEPWASEGLSTSRPPSAALSWAQQPPSCQATLGYHQAILPSPLGPVPCNLTASLPRPSLIGLSVPPQTSESLASTLLDDPPGRITSHRITSHRIASPATAPFPAWHMPAHHTLNATLSIPLQAFGTWPRSGPHLTRSQVG